MYGVTTDPRTHAPPSEPPMLSGGGDGTSMTVTVSVAFGTSVGLFTGGLPHAATLIAHKLALAIAESHFILFDLLKNIKTLKH
jgi:hypothetical protein